MKEKVLVFCALAQKTGFSGSVNITDYKNQLDIYLKNVYVALRSVQHHNADVDVGLIYYADIPNEFRDLFLRNGVNLWRSDFSSFVFPPENKWALAFYKLASLKWAVEQLQYEKYIQIDCDVVCNGQLSDLLAELDDSLVMLSGPFTYSHPIRVQYEKAFELLYHKKRRLKKWGSGLIASNRNQMRIFIEACQRVYSDMAENDFCNDNFLGDEFITSASVEFEGLNITDGKPYMEVYWTDKFYLVSTNYCYDKMVFLHLPDEKERGMLYLFNYLSRNNQIPSSKKLHLHIGLPSNKKGILQKLINKIDGIFYHN